MVRSQVRTHNARTGPQSGPHPLRMSECGPVRRTVRTPNAREAAKKRRLRNPPSREQL